MPVSIDHLVRSRRKTIAIIIQRDGSLTVRAPLRMSELHIQEFVLDHQDWIRKKQAQVRAAPAPMKKEFLEGETFLYRGKEYPLKYISHQRPALILGKDQFLLARSSLLKAMQVFIRWYKTQALEDFSRSVADRASQHKFLYKKIRISSARTRWGSCSSTGTLSFTWRLLMAPPEVIDYVIVHELVHTQIKNHSPHFWRRVAEIMPDFKSRVNWLKKNGRTLSLGDEG